MKLKEFNSRNSMAYKDGLPFIGINIKSGRIRINKSTIDLMKLELGMQVVFSQDEENPKDWYLAIKEGGLLVKQGLDSTSFMAYSRYIAKVIAESCEINITSFRMNIGKEPVVVDGIEYYPVITSSWK